MIKGAEENGHECEMIYLVDLNIKDCTGCMGCQEKGACVFQDDIEKIEDRVYQIDHKIPRKPLKNKRTMS